MTEYIVLEKEEKGWIEWDRQQARSARSAIRQHLDGATAGMSLAGQFVAVPIRSWQPTTVSVETKQQLKFQ